MFMVYNHIMLNIYTGYNSRPINDVVQQSYLLQKVPEADKQEVLRGDDSRHPSLQQPPTRPELGENINYPIKKKKKKKKI